MEFATYLGYVRQIPFGKRLPEALYIHCCGFEELVPELHRFIMGQMRKLQLEAFPFDLVKLHLREFKISLLSYPDFWDDPYPALKMSCTIDLLSHRTKLSSYEHSENPPILHRKETFLPQGHPKIAEFSAQTKTAEEAGLFENAQTIGFKQNWLNRIKKLGYVLNGATLEKTQKTRTKNSSNQPGSALAENLSIEDLTNVDIKRHLTAIERNILSGPMQSLYNHGFLDGQHSVFDFGCGKGDDLRELQAHGVPAKGWDPVYQPDQPKEPADVVNLGFVLNVIEKPAERRAVLSEAFSLAKKVLSVSVMLGGESTISKFK
ncbi:MAG TPA: DNA phosphorothioation-associated putative methyltransferase, partial [Candidatus Ozemobacteraceae bacterium]|nr:DNA phosphorothioation-associated putative methyltransferase [Candidatus Ozemobacteraceae bacterium]